MNHGFSFLTTEDTEDTGPCGANTEDRVVLFITLPFPLFRFPGSNEAQTFPPCQRVAPVSSVSSVVKKEKPCPP